MELSVIQKVAVFALPVLFAITLHEAAHGYVARHFGDMTAYAAGRISLNPLRHIDPIGTILVPLATLLLTSYMFGWAKPVPVNFANLRHPKKDMLWVAAAGPLSNLAMALAWAIALKVGATLAPGNAAATWLVLVGVCGIFVNVIFMVLNLLPLPPLDGGRIAVSLLPQSLAASYSRLEPYGFMVVIILLATGILSDLMRPILRIAEYALGFVLGL